MRADIAQSCRIRSRSRRRSWAASRSRYEDLGVLRIPVRKPASTAIAPNGSETGPVGSRRRPRRGSRNRRDRTARMTVAETSGCRAGRWHNNGHADREVDANLRGRRPGRDPRFHRRSSIQSKKTWELHVATRAPAWVPCAECTGFAPAIQQARHSAEPRIPARTPRAGRNITGCDPSRTDGGLDGPPLHRQRPAQRCSAPPPNCCREPANSRE